jgi:hypothetical protein
MRGLFLMAIRNHGQTDDFRASFKVAERGTFCHSAWLQISPASFNWFGLKKPN